MTDEEKKIYNEGIVDGYKQALNHVYNACGYRSYYDGKRLLNLSDLLQITIELKQALERQYGEIKLGEQ